MKHPVVISSEEVVVTGRQFRQSSHPINDSRRLDRAQFRVLGRYDKLNRAGLPCSRLVLGNLAGTASAVIDHAAVLPCQRNIGHGDIVMVNGELQDVADRLVVQIEDLYRPRIERVRPTALLPKEWVLPAFLPQLRTVIRHWVALAHPGLQRLMTGFLMDANNALGFLNAPASQRFHHPYQGGLLEHTADMLHQLEVSAWHNWRPIEREIAVFLVVLHDIGKTVTLVGQGASERGTHQPHELAALELLALPLAQLQMTDSSIANQIRGFFKPRHWYPRNCCRVYRAVSAIDRYSANYELPERAC
ncbi:hypothetical protein [Spongiibacter sp. UBA1325]|uniref:hypothetical protein n=1 Tax=Spongiibacter sp. UBA1325 TaxID=1947543 RepID=UPI00257F3BEA|nr:hypothetical protein [Spongiibacter sp. UBA1325]